MKKSDIIGEFAVIWVFTSAKASVVIAFIMFVIGDVFHRFDINWRHWLGAIALAVLYAFLRTVVYIRSGLAAMKSLGPMSEKVGHDFFEKSSSFAHRKLADVVLRCLPDEIPPTDVNPLDHIHQIVPDVIRVNKSLRSERVGFGLWIRDGQNILEPAGAYSYGERGGGLTGLELGGSFAVLRMHGREIRAIRYGGPFWRFFLDGEFIGCCCHTARFARDDLPSNRGVIMRADQSVLAMTEIPTQSGVIGKTPMYELLEFEDGRSSRFIAGEFWGRVRARVLFSKAIRSLIKWKFSLDDPPDPETRAIFPRDENPTVGQLSETERALVLAFATVRIAQYVLQEPDTDSS